jgi:hypothetical protein
MRRHLLPLAILTLASSCASTEPLEVRMLPYRVAIIPIAAPTIGAISPGELPGYATGLELELDCDTIAQAVSDALETYCFPSVEVLSIDMSDASTNAFERERLALERAAEVNADLVVELDLRYDQQIYRERAGVFWLSIPLFFLAWPLGWLMEDNDYHADVELTTTVYDRNALEAGNFALGDPAARIVSASARFAGTGLDFIDRSDSFTPYAVGILIPSCFLAHKTQKVVAGVSASITQQLVAQVVNGLQGRRDELVEAEWIAPFHVNVDEVQLQRDGDHLSASGTAEISDSSLVDRIEAFYFNAGADTIVVRPEVVSVNPETGAMEFSFDARVPIAADSTTLRLRCETGSRDRFVRSYTFNLPNEQPIE